MYVDLVIIKVETATEQNTDQGGDHLSMGASNKCHQSLYLEHLICIKILR